MARSVSSAGGILLKESVEGIQLLIVELDVEKRKNIDSKWAPTLRQLPKGGARSGETLEQTALREVLEETGFEAEIIGKAGQAAWSYERNGELWRETVHYFFMKPIEYRPGDRDNEFDEAHWVAAMEASKILSYPAERRLIRAAMIENDPPPLP